MASSESPTIPDKAITNIATKQVSSTEAATRRLLGSIVASGVPAFEDSLNSPLAKIPLLGSQLLNEIGGHHGPIVLILVLKSDGTIRVLPYENKKHDVVGSKKKEYTLDIMAVGGQPLYVKQSTDLIKLVNLYFDQPPEQTYVPDILCIQEYFGEKKIPKPTHSGEKNNIPYYLYVGHVAREELDKLPQLKSDLEAIKAERSKPGADKKRSEDAYAASSDGPTRTEPPATPMILPPEDTVRF